MLAECRGVAGEATACLALACLVAELMPSEQLRDAWNFYEGRGAKDPTRTYAAHPAWPVFQAAGGDAACPEDGPVFIISLLLYAAVCNRHAVLCTLQVTLTDFKKQTHSGGFAIKETLRLFLFGEELTRNVPESRSCDLRPCEHDDRLRFLRDLQQDRGALAPAGGYYGARRVGHSGNQPAFFYLVCARRGSPRAWLKAGYTISYPSEDALLVRWRRYLPDEEMVCLALEPSFTSLGALWAESQEGIAREGEDRILHRLRCEWAHFRVPGCLEWFQCPPEDVDALRDRYVTIAREVIGAVSRSRQQVLPYLPGPYLWRPSEGTQQQSQVSRRLTSKRLRR